MAQNKMYEALLAILLIEVQQTTPSLRSESNSSPGATRSREVTVEACTTREFAREKISEQDGYEGRYYDDVYITGPAVAEIMGVSPETARRRLKYFEEQGILNHVGGTSRRREYELDRDFVDLDGEDVPSESKIVDTAKKILAATEEA